MKLASGDISLRDDRRDWPAVVSDRNDGVLVSSLEKIRMDEIGMQPVVPQRDSCEKFVRPSGYKRVPAHLRNAQIRIGRRQRANNALDPSEPRRFFMFEPGRCEQLHAYADAKEWTPTPQDRLLKSACKSRNIVEPSLAIPKGAHARKDDAIRFHDLVRVRRDLDMSALDRISRLLERLVRRVKVS